MFQQIFNLLNYGLPKYYMFTQNIVVRKYLIHIYVT